MVSAATLTAVSASISTPVWAAILAEELMRMRSLGLGNFERDFAVGQGQGMAERDQLAGLLGGQDAGEARGGQDVAFGDGLGLNQLHSVSLQADFAARDRFAEHHRFAGDVHHAGLAASVNVRQSFCLMSYGFDQVSLRRLDACSPFLDHCPHLLGGVQPGFHVLEIIPRQHAEQIGCDEHLPVAIRPGADADGRNRKPLASSFLCDRRRDQFQDDGEGPGPDQGLSIGEQTPGAPASFLPLMR